MSMNETPYPLRVGPYAVEGRVGQGGMATVLLGRTESHQRPVALKIIRAFGIEYQQQMVRFKREIQALNKLSHPNLVGILDAGFDGEWFYYAMEYMEGGTIRNVLDATPQLPFEKAFRLMAQLTHATAYLHQNRIIHRDIKPSNVLLGNDKTAKLSDLGLLRFHEETDLTQSGQIIGTIRYMSPEMLDKYPMSYGSDIYQLGLLFFEMLAGRAVIEKARPHQMVALILSQETPRVSSFRSDVDPAIDDLIARCLEREPSGRPRDGSELFQELKKALEAIERRIAAQEADDSIIFVEVDDLSWSVEASKPAETPESQASQASVDSPPESGPPVDPEPEPEPEPQRSREEPLETGLTPDPAPTPAAIPPSPLDDDESDPYEPSDADPLLQSRELPAIGAPPEDGSAATDPVIPVMPRWKLAEEEAERRRSSETPAIVDSAPGNAASAEVRTARAPATPSSGLRRTGEIQLPGEGSRASPGPVTPLPGMRRSGEMPPIAPPPGARRSGEMPSVDPASSRNVVNRSGDRIPAPVAPSPAEDTGGERPPAPVIHFSPAPGPRSNDRLKAAKLTGNEPQPSQPIRVEALILAALIAGIGLAIMLLRGTPEGPAAPISLLLSHEVRDGDRKLRARWTLREERASKLRVRFMRPEEVEALWKAPKDPAAIIALQRDPPYMVEIERPSGGDHDVQIPAPREAAGAFVQVDCGSATPSTWVHVSLPVPAAPTPTPTPSPSPTPHVTSVKSPPAATAVIPADSGKGKGQSPEIQRVDLAGVPPPAADPATFPEGLEIVWELPALSITQEILRPPPPLRPSENFLAIRDGASILIHDLKNGARVRRFDFAPGEEPAYVGLSRSDSLIAWVGDRISVLGVGDTSRFQVPCEKSRKGGEPDLLIDRIGDRLVRCQRDTPGRFRLIVNSLKTGSVSWSYTGEGQALGWVIRPGEPEDLWIIQTAPGSGTTSPRVLAQRFSLDTGPGDGSWVTLTVLDSEPKPGAPPRIQSSELAMALVVEHRFIVWKIQDWSKTHDLQLNARMSDPWPEATGPVALARSSMPGEPLVIGVVSDRAVYNVEDGGSASATTGNHHLVLASGSLFRYDITGIKIEATGVIPWEPRGRLETFLFLAGSDEPILDSTSGLIKLRWR